MAEKKGLFSKAGKLSAPEMRPQPRSRLAGLIADAMIGVRDFADRARVPESVPLLGGQGVGSLFLGRAPEEVNELSYGNSPFQINPYAGRTGSYVPEMKRGRGAQVFDALSLLPVPGARTVAGGLFGGGLTPGVDAAATVFHGSPHKFDRFDSSKIGIGEGSQAYGHGLYVADNEATANAYRAMANNPARRQGGLKAEGADQAALDALIQMNARQLAGGDVSKFAEMVQKRPAAFSNPEAILQRIGEYENNLAPSYLYKIALPDEAIAKMLDYDKPLSQQPAAAKHFKEMHELNGGQGYINSDGNYTALGVGSTDELKGKDLVDFLAKMGGGRVDASALLRQAGIPGIRYLDGGSRSAGAGSSNYVIFPGNESLLTILERNGQVMTPIYRDPMGDTLADTIR